MPDPDLTPEEIEELAWAASPGEAVYIAYWYLIRQSGPVWSRDEWADMDNHGKQSWERIAEAAIGVYQRRSRAATADDVPAKAAYRAWKMQVMPHRPPAEVEKLVDEVWPEKPPREKQLWIAIARAVLEAAGVGEMAELLGWYREELEKEWRDCLQSSMRGTCEACHFNPCDTVVKIKRIKAALARAGKEA